jgi:DNA protecting protein DprA
VSSDDIGKRKLLVASFGEDAQIFLGLTRIRGIGFKTLRGLGGVAAIATRFRAEGPGEFLSGLTKSQKVDASRALVEDLGLELARSLEVRGIELLLPSDEEFPRLVHDLPEAAQPLWLFVRGRAELLSRPSVAVVGTRDPTSIGDFLARYAVATLSDLDIPVVSGLARGIDEIAHLWSLTCGVPTVSVLGTGLLRPYPAANSGLADRIVEQGGLLISEYPPDEGPTREHFVWRNRLQAALSVCLIAPEWRRSSGTAHTVRYAKSMGRPTFNLTLVAKQPLDDAGVADLTFDIPAEHDQFVAHIAKAVKTMSGRLFTQSQLSFELFP